MGRTQHPEVSNRWEEALRRLQSSAVVALDLETSGLDFRVNHVVGWVLTFGPAPQDSYYLPVRHQPGGNIMDFAGPTLATGWDESKHPIEDALISGLDQPGKKLIFHNGGFDLKFAWRLGMRKFDARMEDTIINAALLDEYQDRYSLERCCELAGVAAKKSAQIVAYLVSKFSDAAERPKAAMGSFWRLRGDDPMVVEYAEGDGTSTWQLREAQASKLAEQDLGLVHDIESRLIPVLARMSGIGIKIDEERLDYLLGDVDRQIDKLLEKLPPDFNVRSPNMVKEWCEKNGVTNWPYTPGRIEKATGLRKPQPSFPQSWLETHEPGRQIVGVRKLTTLRDTFLKPMKDQHLWRGRVHTTFNQLRGDEYGTITGRLSSSDPNLQAVSKHDKAMGMLHRSIFVPDEGKIWASADYSQIEPRLLAFYSGSKVLTEGYNASPPVDAHTSVSSAMNRNWPNMTKEERKHYRDAVGKRINQSLITGGGLNSLTAKWGMPPDQAKQAWNDYFKAMPEIKPLQQRAAKTYRTRGWVVTLLGRRCRYNDERDYVALNRLLQSGNADAIKTKLVEMDEFLASVGRPIDLLNNIHDDVAFQFDEAHRDVYNECLRIMTDFSSGQTIEIEGVPIVVDAGEGRNWADATFGEEK